MITAFGKTLSLQDHLISLIETEAMLNAVQGSRGATDTGVVLQAALDAITKQQVKMETFIITADIVSRDYMSDHDHVTADIRQVLAETAEQAEQKYEDFWSSKNSDYEHYYSVRNCKVNATIV